jgi:hypothetical protein
MFGSRYYLPGPIRVDVVVVQKDNDQQQHVCIMGYLDCSRKILVETTPHITVLYLPIRFQRRSCSAKRSSSGSLSAILLRLRGTDYSLSTSPKLYFQPTKLRLFLQATVSKIMVTLRAAGIFQQGCGTDVLTLLRTDKMRMAPQNAAAINS